MFRILRLRQRIAQRLASFSLFTATLLSFGLLDEIVAGLPVVGLPLIRDQFRLSYEQVGLLFTLSACVVMVLEPFINLLSDRGSKRYWIVGGALGMGLSFLLAGSAASYAILLLAFVLSSLAGHAAVGLAQAALIDQRPRESARTMTRWTLLSSIGDLLAPLCVSVVVSLHLGWGALCWLAGTIWLAVTLVVAPQRFPRSQTSTEGDGEQNEGILVSFREALRDPVLLRWATLSLLPTMVDEVFLGFAALYLRDVLHASGVVIGIVLALQMGGAMLGLFVLDRFALYQRIPPRRLLSILAGIGLVGMLTFLAASTLWLASLALFVTGLSTSGWYPIAKAQAYARRPGRSGVVRAIISLGAPYEVALPGLIGLVVGHFGLRAGIGLLTLAPVLVLLLSIG